MIPIDRGRATPPASLIAAEARELETLVRVAGARTLASSDFKTAIYASEAVKSALWEMQHQKCCFCEHEYERSFSSVEHFRPKTEARRDGRTDTGYWWLAYAFENLYFACMPCNRPKGTWFRLAPEAVSLSPRQRPQDHDEQPLMLDPGRDDPSQHLTFVEIKGRGVQIAPKGGSDRGRETIRATELDRDDLTTLRNKHFRRELKPVIDRFREAKEVGDKAGQDAAVADARAKADPSAPFALLARVLFAQEGLL